MSLSYFKELSALSRTKKIISLLPARLRPRAAKWLYDYESPAITGIDIVAPLGDGNLACFINTKDIIGWRIFFFGEYEVGTQDVLSKYIKKGDVVIEAGANMGSETLLISRIVGDTGHVYGFEPNPYTFERLSINIAINELRNVDVFDIAMGETDGSVSFNIYPKGFCNPGMSSKYVSTPQTRKITVKQQTLDSMVSSKGIKKVDFIKMDIQGAEMDLLMGANRTLSEYKPAIFLEALQEYNDVKALYGKLRAYGYNIYVIEKDGTTPMPTENDVRDGNWLAVFEK